MIKNIKLPNIYYFLVFVGYVITLFISPMRPGIFAALLMVFILGILILDKIAEVNNDDSNNNILKKLICGMSIIDVVVVIYFLYNFFSFIWLTGYGYPFSVFSGEFISSIFPVIFYFVAKRIGCERESFFKWFLYALAFLGIISVLLYLIAPQFYCDYLYNWSYISKADASTARVRMESVTGSTSMSFLAVAGMAVSSYFIFAPFVEKNKIDNIRFNMKDKNSKLSAMKIFAIIMFIFSVILVFMANGRAGMVAAILLLAYLNVLLVFKFKYIDKKIFFIEIAVVVLLIIAVFVAAPGIFNKIFARLISLPGAVGQRSDQWVAAMNNMKGAWLGNGLGANGHRALYIDGAHVVADGGLIKLFCEEGSVGFGLFVYIMIVAFARGIKGIRNSFAELSIVALALLMSIGSNIIAFQLCAPIFWYSVGSIVMNSESVIGLEK